MSRLAIAAVITLAFSPLAIAQEGGRGNEQVSPSDQQVNVPADVSPEVWMYIQSMKRYDDPKQAVRRKAEQRAAMRRGRLASQKWFGFSPLRPTASPVPFMGTAAPTWVGNSWDPYRWVGPSPYATAVFSVPNTIRR